MGQEDNSNMELQQCWPTVWLAGKHPRLRLLSLEYRAKIFNWEGAQHSFPEQSAAMMKKLAAAGVGKRPVIFVAHSMGGLMVKEMMMQGSYSANEGIDEGIDSRIQDIITNTKGVAFYSAPHFGSWIASASYNLLSWRLKDTINVVLRPGPYLSELNDFFDKFSQAQQVNVISFAGQCDTPRSNTTLCPFPLPLPLQFFFSRDVT